MGGEGGYILKANALRLGSAGLLLCGASGAGKSAVTLTLLERAALKQRSAALIADDYCALRFMRASLYAEAAPHIAGIMEIRGAGLFRLPYENCAQIHLVVELAGKGERYPQGHLWHFPPQNGLRASAENTVAAADALADKTAESARENRAEKSTALPLLKLPQAGFADIIAVCHAIEAVLFGNPYIVL